MLAKFFCDYQYGNIFCVCRLSAFDKADKISDILVNQGKVENLAHNMKWTCNKMQMQLRFVLSLWLVQAVKTDEGVSLTSSERCSSDGTSSTVSSDSVLSNAESKSC